MLKKMKIVNEFQHFKVSNMMIMISRNVFQPNFPFIPINALNSSKVHFNPVNLIWNMSKLSNWFIISDCTFNKHLPLMPFQQTH